MRCWLLWVLALWQPAVRPSLERCFQPAQGTASLTRCRTQRCVAKQSAVAIDNIMQARVLLTLAPTLACCMAHPAVLGRAPCEGTCCDTLQSVTSCRWRLSLSWPANACWECAESCGRCSCIACYSSLDQSQHIALWRRSHDDTDYVVVHAVGGSQRMPSPILAIVSSSHLLMHLRMS